MPNDDAALVFCNKLLLLFGMLAVGLLVLGPLFAIPVWWLWNLLVPDIFGLRQISFMEAWGLYVLACLLVKSASTASK